MESLPDIVFWHRQAEILERHVSSPGSGTGGKDDKSGGIGGCIKVLE